MFSAYVTPTGQAWADFDIYMPKRWAQDLPRRRAAVPPESRTTWSHDQASAGDRAAQVAEGCRAARLVDSGGRSVRAQQ